MSTFLSSFCLSTISWLITWEFHTEHWALSSHSFQANLSTLFRFQRIKIKMRKKYTNPNLCLPYTQWSMVKLTVSRSLKSAKFIPRPCPTEKPIICEDLYTSATLSKFQRFSSVLPAWTGFILICLFVGRGCHRAFNVSHSLAPAVRNAPTCPWRTAEEAISCHLHSPIPSQDEHPWKLGLGNE